MAWRFHGHARVNRDAPEAFGICDRCGQQYNLVDLKFQYDWRGQKLQNLNLRVCKRCYDVPFEHYRPIIVPPDPLPKRQPRPDQYLPGMPYCITDTNGRQIYDTNGQPIMATSQLYVPTLSNAGATPTGITTAPAVDGYEITAPDGGPVILIPE